MQVMYAEIGSSVDHLRLPAEDAEVLPGIKWGSFDELLTPAYWCGQAWQHRALGNYLDCRLGRSLVEEVAACLLGGYGMPAELAVAAFERIRDEGLLSAETGPDRFEVALSEPFQIGGRSRSYRFMKQKARYLHGCLKGLELLQPSDSDIAFRDQLAALPGIGPKTASWIVRNHRASNSVAVIDVHILRACRHIGLFPQDSDAQRNYYELETRFLKFANAIDAPAGLLDALMWDQMRYYSKVLRHSSNQLGLFDDRTPPLRPLRLAQKQALA